MASTTSPLENQGVRYHISALASRIYLEHQPTCLDLDDQRQAWPSLLRHSIAVIIGTGILTRFPSATPFGLTLGADSPCADERGAGTLSLSAREIFTPFIVTHVSILTSDTSSKPHGLPSAAYRTLLYRPQTTDVVREPAASVDSLSPVTSSAQADSTSELLRFL